MGMLTSCACMDWALLGVALGVLGYLYLTWTHSYWKKRGVPFVQPELIFGNIKSTVLVQKFNGETYSDIYHQLEGHKFGGYFKFRQPALMVRDPELIKTVLVKDFASFHDNDFHVTIDDDPMLGRNPFCLEGDAWKKVRSQLTPSFTSAKVKPLFPLINEVCVSLNKYLEQHGSECLEAKEVCAKYTTDCVATCAFGLNGNSFTDPNARFREMGRRMLEPTLWKNIQHMCIILAPAVGRIFKFKFFDEVVADFFRGVVVQAMQYRERNGVTRNDFLQLLMQLKAKSADADVADRVTDEDIAAHATTFFSDGFETSSTTMSHVLYELALNGDVMTRLRDEVDAAMDKHGGITYESLQEMTYMDMVIDESLRLHSPTGLIQRVVTKEYSLPMADGSSCTLPVGMPVLIPTWALHYNAQYYPDPLRFDPERFSEKNKEARSKYLHLPFGEGPRICLGMRFALTQIKAGIASIVHNFDLGMNRRTEVPLQPDPKFFILAAKGGIWLDFTPRSNK